MKYLRKIIWLVIAVVFLASVIIGMGVIFSVKNVNVTLNSYSYSAWDEMTGEEESNVLAEIESIKKAVFDKYGGKLMPYVNEEELAEIFDDTFYVFESCEKVYPCTLNLTVKERREVFVISNSNGTYSTYDSSGTLMRGNIGADEALNNIDKAPNVFINGTTTDEQIKNVASVASIFAERFSSLRSIVEKIDLQSKQGNIIFTLRCGISVYVADYAIRTADKIEAVYNKFLSLTGEEKLSGTIYVVVERDSGRLNVERLV